MSTKRKSLRWRKKNSRRAGKLSFLWRIQRPLGWLVPGLVVKRWMLTSGFGLIVALFGVTIWADLRPIYWLIEVMFLLIGMITKFLPGSITGPIVLLVGISLLILGQSRSFKSIQKAVAPEKDDVLIDALLAKSKLNRGPNIVAIGGGTGLSTLLQGLKRYSNRITAIVTVADDGGSSGILRRELGVQPPGDIRNCLAALSTEESLLTRLFQYRFSSGTGLVGHSFGNLFLSALTSITGNLETAITASSRVLAVQGQVVPATNADVRLWAELENGERIEGESAISQVRSPIARIGCYPEQPSALPSAIEAIENAELIILGPGSLYTSLLPNLLVPEIVEAIQRSKATKLYVCNLMTQPGETDGLDATGHVRAIEAQLASFGITTRIFNSILAQKDLAPSALLEYYLSKGAEPVQCDLNSLRAKGYKVCTASLQEFSASSTSVLRHDPRRLAMAVIRVYKNDRKDL
ncbi:gluconeogenesis factor YvcK family protein [Prochlorococcus sp. MIT 0603]